MSCSFNNTIFYPPKKYNSIHLGPIIVPSILETYYNGILIKVIDGPKYGIDKNKMYNIESFRFCKSVNATDNNPAVNVFFNTLNFLKYLNTIGNVNTLLNTNLLVSIVNYDNLDNAYSTGKYLIYGNGNKFKQMVCPDIVAHEISHMITSNINQLEYKGISGALNESFSDCLSASYEFYLYKQYPTLTGKSDFDVGEDVVKDQRKKYVRTMREPRKINDSKYIDPKNLSYDHGGVHSNSALFNYLFYKCVMDIGLDKQDEFTKNWIEIYSFLPKNCDSLLFAKICLENIKYKWNTIIKHNLKEIGINI